MSSKYCIEVPATIIGKSVSGKAVKSTPLSFLGDIDREKGIIIASESPAKGMELKDRILVMERARGSTVGAYVLYSLYKRGLAPKAIVMKDIDPVLLAGAVLCDITIAYGVTKEIVEYIATGDLIEIDSKLKVVRICREKDY